MDNSMLDTLIIAPLAPLAGLLIFWFIQLLFAESLKVLMREIWENHKAFCRFSNFVALLLQSISHVLGYVLTGIGVGEFSLSVKDTKISPKKEKRGAPLFFADIFLAFGPFFVPPLIIFLIYLPFHLTVFQNINPGGCYTFSASLISFGYTLQRFGIDFIGFLLYLDLLNPFHLFFLLIFLLIGLGIRPSFIEEEEKRFSMLNDISKIKNLILSHPYFILATFVLLYVIFYILYFLDLPFYVLIFSFFGWLSIISISSLLLAHFVVFLIWAGDRLPSLKRYLPLMLPICLYIFYRFVFYVIYVDLFLPLSNVMTLVTTFLAVIAILKYETNKLKTDKEMAKVTERENGN